MNIDRVCGGYGDSKSKPRIAFLVRANRYGSAEQKGFRLVLDLASFCGPESLGPLEPVSWVVLDCSKARSSWNCSKAIGLLQGDSSIAAMYVPVSVAFRKGLAELNTGISNISMVVLCHSGNYSDDVGALFGVVSILLPQEEIPLNHHHHQHPHQHHNATSCHYCYTHRHS